VAVLNLMGRLRVEPSDVEVVRGNLEVQALAMAGVRSLDLPFVGPAVVGPESWRGWVVEQATGGDGRGPRPWHQS